MLEPYARFESGEVVPYSQLRTEWLKKRAAGDIRKTADAPEEFDASFRQWWAQQILKARGL